MQKPGFESGSPSSKVAMNSKLEDFFTPSIFCDSLSQSLPPLAPLSDNKTSLFPKWGNHKVSTVQSAVIVTLLGTGKSVAN